MAQCRQLAREVSARVSHETHELVPVPPAVQPGKADSDEIVVNDHLSTWAEFEEKRLVYWYLIKLNPGLQLEVKTDVNRVIIKVYPAVNRTPNALLKEIKRVLPKGKPFLMSTVQGLVDFAQPKATARVHAEPNELVPVPPAIPKGKDTGDEFAIDKNKRTWAEVLNGSLRFAYWIHARTGLFVMINTDSNRKIDSHEVIGIFKRDVDEKELNALLVKGKPLTMKTLEAVNDLCAQKSVAARVSVDMNGGPLPERDFELDGRKWKFMQRGPTTWYDCELRKGAYLSLLISDGAIADAFVAISGRLRKESADTKARVMAILDKNPKPTIENLRAFFATLAPNHAVTARVSSEKSGLVPRSDFSVGNHVWSVQEGESSYLYKTKVAANTWLLVNVELDNKIDSVWLEDALMRQRPSKANNQLHEFLTRGTRPIATYDAFNTLVKIASRDRSFSLSALGSMTALEVIQARVNYEDHKITFDSLPNVINAAGIVYDEVMSTKSMRAYRERGYGPDKGVVITILDDRSVHSAIDRAIIAVLDYEESLKFPMSIGKFNDVMNHIGRRIKQRIAHEGRRTTARVDFEKDLITNENEMPNVLKVCGGSLELKSLKDAPSVCHYAGKLPSHRNSRVYVDIHLYVERKIHIYLDGNPVVTKQCSLRYPFTRSALEAYVEAELCGVID